ncbi:MAG: porin [Myxococcota bacterium]
MPLFERLAPLALLGLFALTPAAEAAGTKTSSPSYGLPEETGLLPRASMPEGGVEHGWSNHGTTPEAAAPPAVPGKDNMPEGSADRPLRNDPTPTNSDEGRPTPPHIDLPLGIVPQVAGRQLHLQFQGYMRMIAALVENDALPFIGRNDGFRLADIRLGVKASYGEDIFAYVSIDGALAQSTDPNDPNAQLAVGLRDAYMAFVLSPLASIRLGRFKAPYDLGDLEPTGERVFIDAPVESRGVVATEGIQVTGLAVDRQLGLMIHTDKMGLTKDGFDLGYALAITNGKTEDRVLNDNDHFAGFARLMFHFGKWVTLNGAGFIDSRTTGTLPNLLDDQVLGVEGSAVIHIENLRVEGQFLLQHVTPQTAQTGEYNGFGWHAGWSYRIWGFEPAYRFAYFEPNDRVEQDIVMEHTLALSYYFEKFPLRLSVNGTFAAEQRKLDNNRLAFLAQFSF